MKHCRVSLTPQARTDLDDILDYIASRSPLNALRFVERLESEILGLADYGASLPLAPEARVFSFPLRQLVVTPYRVLFRVDADRIVVLHVRHGARVPAVPDQFGNPS